MTILVTGGTGYVGGAVARALRQRGEQVRILARPTSKTEPLAQLGIEIVRGDILDQNSIEAALAGCETLYHAAAIYEFWVPDKQQLIRTEVEGTRNTLAAAQKCGVQKIVYTSTAFTIGEARGQVGTEATPHRGYFCTTYEKAKYQAEEIVRQYIQQGLPAVIVNPSAVYGPGGVKPQGEAMIDAINRKLPMALPGVIGLVYVDDAVQGHLLAAEKGRIGERYILSGMVMEGAELLRRACELAGTKPPPVGPMPVAWLVATLMELGAQLNKRPPQLAKDTVTMFMQGLRVDGSKAERELGLSYTPFAVGLPKTLEWYWEQGLLKQKPKFLA